MDDVLARGASRQARGSQAAGVGRRWSRAATLDLNVRGANLVPWVVVSSLWLLGACAPVDPDGDLHEPEGSVASAPVAGQPTARREAAQALDSPKSESVSASVVGGAEARETLAPSHEVSAIARDGEAAGAPGGESSAERSGDPTQPGHPVEGDPKVPRFAGACTAGERVRLNAVGDVLLHQELQRTAYADPRGARALWADVEDLLADAELTIANLESPLAPGLSRDGSELEDPGRRYDNAVYTAYPSFNVHPLLARGLVESGVDLVTTANNHALDRGPEGIDRTIRELRRAKLSFVGTRTQDDARADRTTTWSVITKAGPLRVAVVACTEWVNQKPDPLHQVLRCKTDRSWIEREVRRLAARDDVDLVAVAPHWGKEYAPEPATWQREWAQRMVDAGASLVLGGHPHVLQPWERLVAKDGHEAGVVWSLGNFASHQQDLPKRSEAIVQVGLVEDVEGRTRVAAFAAHPIHQARDGEQFFVRSIVRDQGPQDAWDHVRSVLGHAAELAPRQAWWDVTPCQGVEPSP